MLFLLYKIPLIFLFMKKCVMLLIKLRALHRLKLCGFFLKSFGYQSPNLQKPCLYWQMVFNWNVLLNISCITYFCPLCNQDTEPPHLLHLSEVGESSPGVKIHDNAQVNPVWIAELRTTAVEQTLSAVISP